MRTRQAQNTDKNESLTLYATEIPEKTLRKKLSALCELDHIRPSIKNKKGKRFAPLSLSLLQANQKLWFGRRYTSLDGTIKYASVEFFHGGLNFGRNFAVKIVVWSITTSADKITSGN